MADPSDRERAGWALPVLAVLAVLTLGAVAWWQMNPQLVALDPVSVPAAGPSSQLTPSAALDDPARRPIQVKTEAEVAVQFVRACRASRKRSAPVLVEFGADWCPDCKDLGQLVRRPAVAARLGKLVHVVLDIGEFTEFDDLRRAFGVNSIPHWAVLRPETCEQPVTRWKRLHNGSMEGVGSEAKVLLLLDGFLEG